MNVHWEASHKTLSLEIPAADLPRSELKSPYQALSLLVLGTYCCVSTPFISLPYRVHRDQAEFASPDLDVQSATLASMRQDARERCKTALVSTARVPVRLPSNFHMPASAANRTGSFLTALATHAMSSSATTKWTGHDIAAGRTGSGVGPYYAHLPANVSSAASDPGASACSTGASDPSHPALKVVMPGQRGGQRGAEPDQPAFRGSDTVDERFYGWYYAAAAWGQASGHKTRRLLTPARPPQTNGTLDAAQALLGIRTHSCNSEPGTLSSLQHKPDLSNTWRAGGFLALSTGGRKRPRSSSELGAGSTSRTQAGPIRAAAPYVGPAGAFSARRDRSWPAHAAGAPASGAGAL